GLYRARLPAAPRQDAQDIRHQAAVARQSRDGSVTLLLEGIAIWKSYGDDDVLKGVDLKVREGECLVLIGPSGSGKSTLLKCLNLLEPISSGSILFQGEEIAHLRRGEAVPVRRRIGMVFQSFELFQHLSAEDNIALARIKVHKDQPAEARELARRLLRK